MSNERVKPTAGGMCSSACPSYVAEAGSCLVYGRLMNTAESDNPNKRAYRCQPYWEAIQDAYQASRKKATRQEYMTIRGHEDTFDDKVNASMADGWQLHGPTSSTWDECRFLYSQAMIRDVPAEPLTANVEVPAGWMVTDDKLAHLLNERIGTVEVPVKVKEPK